MLKKLKTLTSSYKYNLPETFPNTIGITPPEIYTIIPPVPLARSVPLLLKRNTKFKNVQIKLSNHRNSLREDPSKPSFGLVSLTMR